MAPYHVPDGGDDLQIWSEAAQTGSQPTRVDPPTWRLGVGACYKMVHSAWVAGSCEHCNEPSSSIKSGEFLD
jgi:hypothetical protein